MIKIFLTGDNHIGLKYANHDKANKLKECRIDAFNNMVNKANEENCDIFAISGDLFENTYGILKKEIKKLLDILGVFNGYVIILPGNHDYYDSEQKLWQNFESILRNYDNVILLKEYRPYTINMENQDIVFYPAFCETKNSNPGENNLNWIKETEIPKDNNYHIGIAHGAVEGETIDNTGSYFLMSHDELESIPVDAWLIGHTHVPFPRNLIESEYKAGNKIFNAGTHVQINVSNNTEGQCFIIKIDDDKKVSAKKYVSGNLRFHKIDIDVTLGKLEEQMEDYLKNIDDNSSVEITLSGTLDGEEYENRKDIIKNSLSRFLENKFEDNISMLITKEKIDSEFTETSFDAMLLTELIDIPKEAQLVYELLKELKEGK